MKSTLFEKNSLIRRSLLWCSATLAVFLVVACTVSFFAAWERAEDEQDHTLKQVVGLISRDVVAGRMDMGEVLPPEPVGGFYGPGASGYDPSKPSIAALTMDDDDFEDRYEADDDNGNAVLVAGQPVTVRLLHGRGRALTTTFTRTYEDGAHTAELFGQPYRIYFRTLSDGTHVAAAQNLEERNETVLFTALVSTAPLLMLAPVMLLILGFVLWKSLRPLKTFAQGINARKPEDLSEIRTEGIPQEIKPSVEAMNRLLARVQALREREARFTADAAHELRSPMTALSLQAERLAACKMSKDVRDRVTSLQNGISRATDLITQLLALKRAQAADGTQSAAPARAGCLTVIASVMEELYWAADEKSIDFEAEGLDTPSADKFTAAVGESDLFTMVRNLVQNAVKYTPENGTVKVSVTDAADCIRICVADSGPGVAPEERGRIFDPFYRILGSKETGTGLGLSIVKTIAQRTSTEISLDWTDAVKKTGLTVTLTLKKAL